jgi:hypothetical protein
VSSFERCKKILLEAFELLTPAIAGVDLGPVKYFDCILAYVALAGPMAHWSVY